MSCLMCYNLLKPDKVCPSLLLTPNVMLSPCYLIFLDGAHLVTSVLGNADGGNTADIWGSKLFRKVLETE